MEDKRIKNFSDAKRAVKAAEDWNNLPCGRRYKGDNFEISIAHCKPPMLTRAGQQNAGGQNYWETKGAFNQAILEYLVSTWDDHYPKVLEILNTKERERLKECQSYIDEMQSAIDTA